MPFQIISDSVDKYTETRNLRLLNQNDGWPFVCDVAIRKDKTYEFARYSLDHEATHFSRDEISAILEIDNLLKELPEITTKSD